MSFARWLKNYLSLSRQLPFRAAPPAARRPLPRFRPSIEGLEGRLVSSTLTVTSTADKGACSLRADLAAAQSGDIINFASSLNGQTITLKSELLINKNLTITGLGAGQLTVSGGNVVRVFELAQGTQVSLSGLTISNGYATNGAGVLVDAGALLSVSNCTLTGNAATLQKNYVANNGGGIDNYGRATVSHCTLANNTSGSGGGIYNHATLTVIIDPRTVNRPRRPRTSRGRPSLSSDA